MTTIRFNMPAGQVDKARVTTATGSGISTDIARILLDDANATSKKQVLDAIEALKAKIIETQWPL